MNLDLDKTMSDEIETSIRPTLHNVITLPVFVDGRDLGVAVYVAVSIFTPVLDREDAGKAVREIAKRLSL